MAMCPYCFEKKPFWARYCHSCNRLIGIIFQFIVEMIRLVGMIIGVVILFLLLGMIF